jgi:RNA polymerase sigma-70 factor (ECF subfamily)
MPQTPTASQSGFESPAAGFCDEPKIYQRNPGRDLSDPVKANQMADADSELVLRSQQGDAAAFEELVRHHQRMVHALTYRMTGSLTDAEDLAQEAFLRAYKEIGGFRGNARFSTWLYRIAVNACLNWRQSEARRHVLYAQAAPELLRQRMETEGPSDIAAGQVQAALLKLPAKQRAAIVLTTYDGLTHAEAGEVLGCSETTVSWRVFAAKRKLKRFLSAPSAAAVLPDAPAAARPGEHPVHPS